VLGEMLELGADSADEHGAIGAYAAGLGLDHVVSVGEGARALGAPEWVPDTEAAYDLLVRRLRPGDVVLLKSSRDSGLRWLGDRLAGIGDAGEAPAQDRPDRADDHPDTPTREGVKQ
jgi:UDP-N-acetylmuramoyl-tripeptide--D-alanyl-D-alanine ligase